MWSNFKFDAFTNFGYIYHFNVNMYSLHNMISLTVPSDASGTNQVLNSDFFSRMGVEEREEYTSTFDFFMYQKRLISINKTLTILAFLYLKTILMILKLITVVARREYMFHFDVQLTCSNVKVKLPLVNKMPENDSHIRLLVAKFFWGPLSVY